MLSVPNFVSNFQIGGFDRAEDLETDAPL